MRTGRGAPRAPDRFAPFYCLMSEPLPDDGACAVVVTVEGAPELLLDLARQAQVGLERFPDWPGYVHGALHVSPEGDRMVQYLLWTSEEHYRAAVDDPVWDTVPSKAVFLAAVASGAASMDVRVYRVLARSGRPAS